MSRYMACEEFEPTMDTHVTVYEADEWIDTGLLDSNGHRLYRTDRVAMGIQIDRVTNAH